MKKPQPKKRRLLTTKILVVIGVAIVCAVSIFIYARNQQLLREDETSFRAMQAEVDAVRDEVSQKTGLTSKKVAYCSHRSEKYKDGPLFCLYGYSFGTPSDYSTSEKMVAELRSLTTVSELSKKPACIINRFDVSSSTTGYAPSIYCQPDTRKAYFPMREE
jgi:hypothetical protein